MNRRQAKLDEFLNSLEVVKCLRSRETDMATKTQLAKLYRNHSADELEASLRVANRLGRDDHVEVIVTLLDEMGVEP